MAGFLLPAPLVGIGSHQRLRRWLTRAVRALALRVRASRRGCESAVRGRFGESNRAYQCCTEEPARWRVFCCRRHLQRLALTNECVVGSLGPSWPSPCGSAPHGAAANRPSLADSASPIAPTKKTKEPARWRVFFVSAPMANGTLTNDYVVGSLGPSGPSPLRVRASRRGCESAVLGRFGESNRAYQCCTEEPARWRVFLCPRQWPTGLSPTTASLAHSGRPGPRPAGPRLAARLRIGLPWPIRRVPSRPWRPVCGARLRCFYYCRARGRARTVEKMPDKAGEPYTC